MERTLEAIKNGHYDQAQCKPRTIAGYLLAGCYEAYQQGGWPGLEKALLTAAVLAKQQCKEEEAPA